MYGGQNMDEGQEMHLFDAGCPESPGRSQVAFFYFLGHSPQHNKGKEKNQSVYTPDVAVSASDQDSLVSPQQCDIIPVVFTQVHPKEMGSK